MLNFKSLFTGSLALVCAAGIAQAATPTPAASADQTLPVKAAPAAKAEGKSVAGSHAKATPVAAAQAKPGATTDTAAPLKTGAAQDASKPMGEEKTAAPSTTPAKAAATPVVIGEPSPINGKPLAKDKTAVPSVAPAKAETPAPVKP